MPQLSVTLRMMKPNLQGPINLANVPISEVSGAIHKLEVTDVYDEDTISNYLQVQRTLRGLRPEWML
jgi:hypothetical protein